MCDTARQWLVRHVCVFISCENATAIMKVVVTETAKGTNHISLHAVSSGILKRGSGGLEKLYRALFTEFKKAKTPSKNGNAHKRLIISLQIF